MASDLDELADLDDLGDLDIGDLGDLGEEGEVTEGKGTGKGKGGKKRLIIIAVAVLLIAGGAGYFFMGSETTNKTASAGEEGEEDEDTGERQTAYYFSLNPPFVVNFAGGGQARFLQVNVDGVTRNSALKEDITLHIPAIRHSIVLLLSGKTYKELITTEGKEKLRMEVLVELKKILRRETGKDDIEDVFFTSFVMQ